MYRLCLWSTPRHQLQPRPRGGVFFFAIEPNAVSPTLGRMKILIFAIGTRGDVQPFVALAHGLLAAGHDVKVSAPKNFSAYIEGEGIAAAPLPTDFQAMLEEPEMKAAMNSIKGRLKAFRWATDIMNAQLSAIWSIGQEVQPDVIIHHFKAPISAHLARKLGAVSLPVLLQPAFAPTRAFPPSILFSKSLGGRGNKLAHHLTRCLTKLGTGMMVKRWLKASGTDIGPPLDMTAGFGSDVTRIHAYSPSLVPRPEDWPDGEVQPGYFLTEPQDFEPPADLSGFLDTGETPLYMGFGSMPNMDHETLNAAILGALEKTGQRAVIATGWGGIGGLDAAENVHILESVPHSWLFPRVSAVVHHGGSGTTHEGLRWGKPSVICPFFADQPFFGERVYQLGAGPAPIRQKNLTAENLAEAISIALLPETRAAAERVAAAMRAENAVADMVRLIGDIRP